MTERITIGLRVNGIPEFSEQMEFAVRCQLIFNSMLDFLLDPRSFPNRDINRVAEQMKDLLVREKIQMVAGWDVPELSFAMAERQGVKMPVLLFPQDYPAMVQGDLVWQLGRVATIESLVRDYYAGMIPDLSHTNQEVRLLTGAICAETILTLNEMAGKEGVERQPCEMEKRVLQTFPAGLKSLPPGLYQTDQVIFSSDTPND